MRLFSTRWIFVLECSIACGLRTSVCGKDLKKRRQKEMHLEKKMFFYLHSDPFDFSTLRFPFPVDFNLNKDGKKVYLNDPKVTNNVTKESKRVSKF